MFGVSNFNTFIQHGCIKLIEMHSKDFYIITKNAVLHNKLESTTVFNFEN